MGLLGGEEAVAGLPPALEGGHHSRGEASSEAAMEVAEFGEPGREGRPEGGRVTRVAAVRRPLQGGPGGTSVL